MLSKTSYQYKNIFPIFRREMFSFFYSPVAYIVISAFLLIIGWYFSSQMFIISESSLREVFGTVPFVFVFFVPAITMRLVSEERRSGTIELLFTMPISDIEIILGKYFAGLAFLAVAVFFTFPFAISIIALGSPDIGMMLSGYFGLFLMGAAYIAIGIFASTISTSQVIAFIVAFTLIFIFWSVGQFLTIIPPKYAQFFQYISVNYHFSNLQRGVVDSRNIIFFLTIIVTSLSLAKLSLESRKWG